MGGGAALVCELHVDDVAQPKTGAERSADAGRLRRLGVQVRLGGSANVSHRGVSRALLGGQELVESALEVCIVQVIGGEQNSA